jgi:UDP-2,3-diacylglucosamine pyrophosphatase LpxH
MAQSIERTWEKLDDLWASKSILSLPTKGQRFVLFSDIHLGDGGKADDFFRNRSALQAALQHYRQEGYTLVLLGDIEELWQFDLADIVRVYEESIYRQMRAFGDERRIRIFGNHDLEWGGLIDPTRNHFPEHAFAPEALKLQDGEGKERFLLVHGHQGSLESDTYIWFSRFFVRLYSNLESILRILGIIRNPSAAKSQIARGYERVFYTWAKRNRAVVICGHSHRAIFAARSYAERLREEIAADRARAQTSELSAVDKKDLQERIETNLHKLAEEKRKGRLIDPLDPDTVPLPCYFNTGCGLYNEGVTSIEIDDDDIRLVKWSISQPEAAAREVFHSGKISQFVDEIDGATKYSPQP